MAYFGTFWNLKYKENLIIMFTILQVIISAQNSKFCLGLFNSYLLQKILSIDPYFSMWHPKTCAEKTN